MSLKQLISLIFFQSSAKNSGRSKKNQVHPSSSIFLFPDRTIASTIPAISTTPSPYERDELLGSNSTATEYFDPKERSKERKKNVEMNRTDDKRSNAMAALKAKREGKQRREEEEAKRQAVREGNEDLDSGKANNLE